MTDAAKVFTDPLVVQLADAAQHGDAAEVVQLLHRGADVRAVGKYGMTIPHFVLLAPRANAPLVMKNVLDAGADPVSVRVDGNTVPMIAVSRDDADPEMVSVLLDHGIGPNWRPPKEPYAQTALLHQAISGHNMAVVKLLLKRGADVNYVDPFEGSALHAALGGTQFDIAAVLVDAGIDLSLQNNTSPDIKSPRTVRRTALEYFCKFDGGKRGANPLPQVAAGWAHLQAALARRGAKMPCDL
jgi:ankyrin repeat protein